MTTTCVTSYVDPDIDGVACAVAYAEFLRVSGGEADAFIIGVPTIEARYVLEQLEVVVQQREKFLLGESVVLVDASESIHVENHIPLESVVEIIDHRVSHNAGAFVNARVHIELVGAAATLVAERFFAKNITPSSVSSRLLQAAIVSNTQNFQAKTTTPRDHSMMAWLSSIAPLRTGFIHEMFVAKSDMTGEKLFQNMDTETGIVEICGKRFGVVQLEMIGTDALVHSRLSDIIRVLETLKQNNALDHIFLTLLDIEESSNRFVTVDTLLQGILTKALSIYFKDGVAHREGIMMRKEIIPLLKKAWE